MNVIINANSAFLICDELGDINILSNQGLYFSDTRFLNQYQLLIANTQFEKLTGRPASFYSSVHYSTNPEMDGIKKGSIVVSRIRFIGKGLHEDIKITNFGNRAVKFPVKLVFNNDFADIFDVRANSAIKTGLPINNIYSIEDQTLNFIYKEKSFYRQTKIVFGKKPLKFDSRKIVYAAELKPQESFSLSLIIQTLESPKEKQPLLESNLFGAFSIESKVKLFREDMATIETDDADFQQAYAQSTNDLATLTLTGAKCGRRNIPAAGIPWFMTCFGRDSIITALQTLTVMPQIAYEVLTSLVEFQGKKVDENTEEEPGKIIHEARLGRSAETGKSLFAHYYGTVDATLLFIILIYEFFKFTGDEDFLFQFKKPLKKALSWINRYGDIDGDGYVEYQRKNPKGLYNQGWKDSWDGVAFDNGEIPASPIALCEVQGYAYDAKKKGSALLKRLGEKELAEQYLNEAEELKSKFLKDFWIEDENYIAQALDKNKTKVDSVTSNPGHLLWSKILDPKTARIVADRLLSDEFFSGWGARTLSSKSKHYNPTSYHNGSVWPHDNSLIVSGLINYGFLEHAYKIINGIVHSSLYFPYTRAPELFCGFNKSSSQVPIEYPSSNIPQAWAAGSVPFMLSSLLRITVDTDKKTVYLNPSLLPNMNRLVIKGLTVLDTRLDIEIKRKDKKITIQILNKPEKEVRVA